MSELDLVAATAQDIVHALNAGEISSVELIERYLDAIKKDNLEGKGLHAVIETVSREKLLARAEKLDEERKGGDVRSLMHGLPVLVNGDTFDLDYDEFGIRATAGTFALMSARPRGNSAVVQSLIDGGAIILGTSNMTVMSCGLGPEGPSGWSPRGGQCVSAYGPHLDVATSSSGSAIAVSAGFCAVAIGSETTCSVNSPSNCAALYGLKVTPGSISREGVIPLSSMRQDSPGAMGKSPWDLAAVLSCIATPPHPTDYVQAVEAGAAKSITDFRIAIAQSSRVQGIDPDNAALLHECRELYEQRLQDLQPTFPKIHCPVYDQLLAGSDPFGLGDPHYDVADVGEYAENMDAYLGTLRTSNLKTMNDLMSWFDANPDLSFHPNAQKKDEDPQLFFRRAAMLYRGKTDKYASAYAEINERFNSWREELIDFMDAHKLDLIVIPAGVVDLISPALGAPTLLPVGSIPVGQLSNGAPVGLFVLGRPNAETTILSFMACAEKVLPPRPTPKMS